MELPSRILPGFLESVGPDRDGDEGAPPGLSADGNAYEATADGIVWHRPAEDGTPPVPLSNFSAEIAADVSIDDGAERRREFEIVSRTDRGEHRFTVAAARFASLDWVSVELGAQAVVYPGLGRRERLRCAVQLLSRAVERRTVYAHAGWREVAGEWLYLHAGGALGKDGASAGVEVALPDALARLELAGDAADAREAVAQSLGFLDAAPRRVTLPLLAATYRATLGGADFSLHLAGESGTGKTELAALCQQHYGAAFDARHLPASWSSTANALEATAFAAKDALLVVDDFCPQGSGQDVARLHGAADRLLRAQGNSSRRARSTGRPSPAARSSRRRARTCGRCRRS
jgi:hypothetical protein